MERELQERHPLRQRLHQLLDALEREAEPTVEEFIDALEAMRVIEIDVEDVVIQCSDDDAGEPPPRSARERMRLVLLAERGGERVLAIWIGAQEGELLAARLGEWSQKRPMGPDLTAELLSVAGVCVERVVIETLRGMTYYASVRAGHHRRARTRPSRARRCNGRGGLVGDGPLLA